MSASATATKPAAPMVATSVNTELTHEVFLQHMTAMKGHYKSANSNNGTGPTHAYALPVHLVVPTKAAPNAKPDDGSAEVDASVKMSQTNAKSFAQMQTNAVNAATNKLQGNHDTSQFAAEMNAQREAAKAQPDKQIDDSFDNLINLGTKYPAQQKRILSLTQQIGSFFTNLLSSVANFFVDIYNKIVGWINSAIDWIKGAAEAVGNWLSGAVNTIGNFFGSLF